VSQLVKSSRPLIVAGGGVNWSDATRELVEFAELTGLPVAVTTGGRGAFPETHPLFVGVPGRWGNRTASEALKESDFILGVGCRFSDVTTENWRLIDPSATIVQVDIDESEIARQYPVDIGLIADCKMFLIDAIQIAKQSLGKVGLSQVSPRAKTLSEKLLAERKGLLDVDLNAVPISTRRLLKDIDETIPRDAIISVGGGRHSHFVGQQTLVHTPRSSLRSVGFGAIGFAFPAALGAKLAFPNRQVLCLVGDGDFSMVMQDIETAVREKINVITVVFNDSSYSSVKILQHHHYGRYIGVDYTNPDFAKFAEISGARGFRVERPSEIKPALEASLKENRPCLLDVIIDPVEKTGYGVFST